MHTHKIDVFVAEAWNQQQVSSCGPTLSVLMTRVHSTKPWTWSLIFSDHLRSNYVHSKSLSRTNSIATVVADNRITLYLHPNWWQKPKGHSCNMINAELIL